MAGNYRQVIAHRRLVRLDPETTKRLADYRVRHEHATETEAVRALIRKGLDILANTTAEKANTCPTIEDLKAQFK